MAALVIAENARDVSWFSKIITFDDVTIDPSRGTIRTVDAIKAFDTAPHLIPAVAVQP